MKVAYPIMLLMFLYVFACKNSESHDESDVETLSADLLTDTLKHDPDDPAIWINHKDPDNSLIIGTDKDEDGALYVFDLNGKIVQIVGGLKRPNNVDIEYGLQWGDTTIDIAVTTERFTSKLRVFKLPDMTPIDGGGIEVFQAETGNEYRDLMGIGLYRTDSGAIHAIVGRKNGPKDGYLWQYQLFVSDSVVKANLIRKFGKFSGKKEIEAICVDDALGYIYYSDENTGTRKYYADPEKGNDEISLFGTSGFKEDNEGISIYPTGDSTGYILISDQQRNAFRVYDRLSNEFIVSIPFDTEESDGSEATAFAINSNFPKGLFVAMSDSKRFHLYKWEHIAEYLP